MTLRQARTRARELMAMIAGGMDPNAPGPTALTLGEVWEMYRRSRAPDLSRNTVGRYQDRINGALRRWLRRPLKEITLPLSRFLVGMLERGGREDAAYESPFVFLAAVSPRGFVLIKRPEDLPVPHAYRHTHRTLALEGDFDYTSVCLLLNHKLPDVSFNYISSTGLSATP